MTPYHKIDSLFKRENLTKNKRIIEGDFSTEEFAFLQNNEWIFTRKVNGTNIRIMLERYNDTHVLNFAGRTDNADIPKNLKESLYSQFYDSSFRNKAAELFKGSVCLYGEGHGLSINSGKNYAGAPKFVLFDIKVGEIWLKRTDVEDIADKLQIEITPIIGIGTLKDLVELVKEGFKSHWGDFIEEGIVARPLIEMRDRRGYRIITKLKHSDLNN